MGEKQAAATPAPRRRSATPWRAAIALAALALAASDTAAAHGAFGSAAPFWSGALHVGVSPLALAAIVGLGAALAAASTERVLQGSLLAGVVAGLAAAFLPQPFGPIAAPLGALVPGLAAALVPREPRTLALLLGAAAGIGVGASVGPDARAWDAALGAGMATLIAAVWAAEILARLRRFLPLAPRVVGAWVAAIALLLGALALKSVARP